MTFMEKRSHYLLTSLVRVIFVTVILIMAGGCAPEDACRTNPGSEPPLHVLFIGNSYTFFNDLPGTFARLACSGGYTVEVDMAVQGGWTLADHAASGTAQDKLKEQKWDYVILQDQSEIPAIEAYRQSTMFPAVRQLNKEIRKLGAKPELFLTWGHRDGLPEAGLKNFSEMQAQLSNGYYRIGKELNIPVVPVGVAWIKARELPTPLNLWQDDGSHPNESGTYLAACVFYAAIYQQSPEGLKYSAGLSQDSAQVLQTLAASVMPKP